MDIFDEFLDFKDKIRNEDDKKAIEELLNFLRTEKNLNILQNVAQFFQEKFNKGENRDNILDEMRAMQGICDIVVKRYENRLKKFSKVFKELYEKACEKDKKNIDDIPNTEEKEEYSELYSIYKFIEAAAENKNFVDYIKNNTAITLPQKVMAGPRAVEAHINMMNNKKSNINMKDYSKNNKNVNISQKIDDFAKDASYINDDMPFQGNDLVEQYVNQYFVHAKSYIIQKLGEEMLEQAKNKEKFVAKIDEIQKKSREAIIKAAQDTGEKINIQELDRRHEEFITEIKNSNINEEPITEKYLQLEFTLTNNLKKYMDEQLEAEKDFIEKLNKQLNYLLGCIKQTSDQDKELKEEEVKYQDEEITLKKNASNNSKESSDFSNNANILEKLEKVIKSLNTFLDHGLTCLRNRVYSYPKLEIIQINLEALENSVEEFAAVSDRANSISGEENQISNMLLVAAGEEAADLENDDEKFEFPLNFGFRGSN